MNKRAVGSGREAEAADFLKNRGFEIAEMNFRCRIGEIDIIAKDGKYLVFVEVKYRASAAKGSPLEAVGFRKQWTISRVASYYLLKNHLPETTACRFDVVGMTPTETVLLKNAFNFIPY
ncbi:MAG TPA: YraN family protein [Lachnospiraceae bacterium]|nr:YraN family protein [Lachnospiraceae bacterium]